MGILYYNANKRKVILSKSVVQLVGDSVALAEGPVTVSCSMSKAGYYINIGDLEQAFLIRPLMIAGPVTFHIEPQNITQLPQYTPEIDKLMCTLRNSRTLNQLIWDYIGISRGNNVILGEVTSIHILPALSEGRNPMRLCEGYATRFGVNQPVLPLFFTTPSVRSLGRVARYRLERNSGDQLVVRPEGI